MADKNILFRPAGRGYNKEDVNNYIQEKSMQYSMREANLVKQLADLENRLNAAMRANAEAVGDTGEIDNLSRTVDELECENHSLAAALAEKEAKITELERALNESRASVRPSEGDAVAELSARLGDILVKASLQAEEIVKEAETKAKNIIDEAGKNAESITLDAKVEARITANKAKADMEKATDECLGNLRVLASKAIESYRAAAENTAEQLVSAAKRNFTIE